MKLFRILPSLLLSLLLLGQGPVVAIAAAEVQGTPAAQLASPSPTTAVTPSPSPSPSTAPKLPEKPGYAFNDGTGTWDATDQTSFTWDAGLDRWVSSLYWYESKVGWYHVKAVPASSPAPSTALVASPESQATSGKSAPAAGLGAGSVAGVSSSNTGPGSLNSSTAANARTLLSNAASLASITNADLSAAISGAANVSTNTFGGNATTGPASVVANYINLLSSMWSWGTGGLSTFILDIFGDHVGDINIDVPGATGGGGSLGSCGGSAANNATGPLSLNTATNTCSSNTTGNNSSKGSIVNNIDLSAKSGAANVQGNTKAGDATSGDATASLNIINLINSSIGAGRSFFGMINIYGSLDGDILFPGLSLDAAIAGSSSSSTVGNANTGTGSTNNASASDNNNSSVNNTAKGAFNNNIDASAASGAANVQNNTNAGSARSGTADTNTNTFNLFNTDIFGDNAVLVLINDMGHWVGRIMNLPGGQSGGALLTSNAKVTNNNTGVGSSDNATSSNSNNGTINNSADGTITNNVKAHAQSGDANVQNNTTAGNATSGKARVATNIANIFGSHLSFGKTFGILIVNVFGSWTGSVGVDTAAGSARAGQNRAGVATHLAASANPSALLSAAGHIVGGLLGNSNNTSTVGGSGSSGSTTGQANNSASSGTTLAASSNAPVSHAAAASQASTTGWIIVFAGVSLLSAGALGSLDRRWRRRRN